MACKKKKAEIYLKEFENNSVKIPWDCFVYILKNFFEFEMVNKSGSKRLFRRGRIRFTADEPHSKGDKVVHKDDRKRAIIQLKQNGFL